MRLLPWGLLGAMAVVALGALPVEAGKAILQAAGTAEPEPFWPDTQGRLRLDLTNAGDAPAYRVQARILSLDPPLAASPSMAAVDLGGIAALGAIRTYPFGLRVPAGTVPGTYYANVGLDVYYLDAASQTQAGYVALSIPVRVRAPGLLSVASVAPASFDVGQDAQATVVLANDGTGTFSNVVGTWSSEGGALLPLGGSNAFHVARVEPGATAELDLRVAARPGALPGLYALRFNYTYTDAGGTTLASSAVVGVRLMAPARQVELTLDEAAGGRWAVAATNVGTSPVTGVQVRLLPAAGQSVLGHDAAVVGNLAAGDSALARFDVDGAGPVAAEASYTDAAGTRRVDRFLLGQAGGVAARPDVHVTVQAVESDKVTLAVTNVGSEPVTGVQVQLLPSETLQPTGADTLAVGPLLPGAFAVAEFDAVHADGFAADVAVRYTDTQGERRSVVQGVAREAPAASGPSDTVVGTVAAAAAVALAAAAGLLYRRRRKQRARAEKEAQAQWNRLGPGVGERAPGTPPAEEGWRPP